MILCDSNLNHDRKRKFINSQNCDFDAGDSPNQE